MLTKEQKQEIINSDLPNVELAKIYNRNPKTISGIRIKAGKGNKDKRGNFTITPEQKEIILNSDLTVKQASELSKISKRHIYTIRRRNGIEKPIKVKAEKPKRQYKTRPKKEKVIKPQVVKITKSYAPKPAITFAEQEYLIRKTAREIAKNNPLNEADKIAKGTHRWITRVNKFGKKESALIKI